jgi:hypothetical protein
MLVKVFGYLLAAGVVGTSAAMAVMGARWQEIEAAAYGGERRPGWFWLGSAGLMSLYLGALGSFLRGPKTWAGWALMVIIPLGWLIKGALVIFNPAGRQRVSSISGAQSWRNVALARLPVAVVLAVLARLA